MGFVSYGEDSCLFFEDEGIYEKLKPESEHTHVLINIPTSSYGKEFGRYIYGVDERENEEDEWRYGYF